MYRKPCILKASSLHPLIRAAPQRSSPFIEVPINPLILYEIQYGKRHKYNDKGTRIDSILKQLKKSSRFDIIAPELLPYNALLAVHDDDYLKFLESSQNLNNDEI